MAAFKLLTILATLGVAYSHDSPAPVLIWGNHRSIDKMTSNSGKFITENVEDFMRNSDFKDGENPHVLIGVVPSLSMSDLFKKYDNDNVFGGVQKLMSGSTYTNFFAQAVGSPKENHSFSEIQNMVASSDPKQIHVIKITPKGEDSTETLKMSDNIMHKACKEHASQYKSYICVLTGSSGGQEENHARIARSLLQVTPTEEPDLSQDVYFLANFALVYTKPSPYLENKKSTPPEKYNLSRTTALVNSS